MEGPATPIADRLHAAMGSLLAQDPTALVGAAHIDTVFVPVPPSVPLREHRAVNGRSCVDIVVPDDRAAVGEAWKRAVANGSAREEVHLVERPDEAATMHILDLRVHHGVFLVVVRTTSRADRLAAGAGPARPRTGRCRLDALGTILDVDDAFVELFARHADEAVGASALDAVHPDDRPAVVDTWVAITASSTGGRVRYRHAAADGTWRWVELVGRYHDDEATGGVVEAELTDVGGEVAALEALDASEQLLDRLADSLPTGILQLRADRTVAYTNDRLHEILGTPPAPTVEAQLAAVEPDDRPALDAALDTALDGADADVEVGVVHEGRGEVRRCQLALRPLAGPDGRVDGAVVTVADVTESTQLRRELEHRASFDVLTRCHNRAAVMGVLEAALHQHDRNLAVVSVDLDGLRTVNDTLGQTAGDELLVVAADRLREVTRGDDVVGRVGGDEFLVVCPSVETVLEAAEIGERVAAALRGEVELAAGPVELRASIGLVHAEPRSLTADELVARADAAREESERRAAGRPVVRHLGAGGGSDEEQQLRHAIEHDLLAAHFQPVVDLATGAAVGFEALLRWRRGDRTLDAAEFIELADHSGLILEIGSRARDEVWGLAADARRRTGRHDHLWFLNLSPAELAVPGFAESVERLVAEHAVPAGSFVIEVSATSDRLAQPAARRAVLELRELGVRTALANVGPGASLELLRTLPVDVLKVAPAYTAELGDPRTAHLVGALLDLARRLDLLAVVEGIEDEAARDAAVALGATVGQGHLFAPAAPLAELLPWFEPVCDAPAPRGSLQP